MKIELILHKKTGEIRRYPVYKMVRHNEGWLAYYTTFQKGCHVSKDAMIDGEKARIEIREDLPGIDALNRVCKQGKLIAPGGLIDLEQGAK